MNPVLWLLLVCAPGHFYHGTRSECVPCPPGTSSLEPNSTYCTRCTRTEPCWTKRVPFILLEEVCISDISIIFMKNPKHVFNIWEKWKGCHNNHKFFVLIGILSIVQNWKKQMCAYCNATLLSSCVTVFSGGQPIAGCEFFMLFFCQVNLGIQRRALSCIASRSLISYQGVRDRFMKKLYLP